LADNVELVKVIRENILATTKEKAEGDMKDYTGTIPKTGVKYDMLAIKGGEFTMGSPADEKGRADDEGPQHKVKVSPFWMGKFEVTWNMYEPFMITGVARNKDGSPENIPADAKPVDVVSSPTTPYTEMSFGMGTDGFPAICMTEHAASKFCQWLSAQTGHYYRLPTEAEWEYACRAGTTGAYSCPEDQLADFAVMDPEQVRVGYEKVGTKKPNPWGLHDMHGNVMEWCIDQYLDKGYAGLDGKTTENPLAIPTTLYPRVARGGSWYDPPEELRSARRIASNENWKVQDPQLPKSIWYHTDAHWLGFRIVRPLEVPETEKMHLLWNLGTVDSN
jgi:formylglycine-generating enzyme required for sulfatase activity